MSELDPEALLDAQLEQSRRSATTQQQAVATGNGSGDAAKDSEKDRSQDKDRRDRDRDRDRERDRDRDRRDRDRDRDRRDRDRDDRDRGRKRSRSPRRRSRSPRDRRRSRSPRRRSPAREEPKKRRHGREETAEETRILDQDRDFRTVFVYQLNKAANEDDLAEFFNRAGQVRDVKLVTDRNSRKSKGIAYVEFYLRESVDKALGLAGQPLKGYPIMVQPTQAEKNRAAQVTAYVPGGDLAVRRIYMYNIHPILDDNDIRDMVECFGDVENVVLEKNQLGGPSIAGVVFKKADNAQAAVKALNDLPLGEKIRVSFVNETAATDLTMATAQQLVSRIAQGTMPGVPGMMMGGGGAMTVAASSSAAANEPSECIVLKNMFDPVQEEREHGPEWDLELRGEVMHECSNFGKVRHIFVDKNSAGFIYLKFGAVNDAVNARNTMHGRWFSQQLISAEFVPVSEYNIRFPDSA